MCFTSERQKARFSPFPTEGFRRSQNLQDVRFSQTVTGPRGSRMWAESVPARAGGPERQALCAGHGVRSPQCGRAGSELGRGLRAAYQLRVPKPPSLSDTRRSPNNHFSCGPCAAGLAPGGFRTQARDRSGKERVAEWSPGGEAPQKPSATQPHNASATG